MLNFIYTLSLRVKITLAALISIIIISSTLTMLASDKLWQQTRSGIYSRAISVSDTAIPSFEFWLEKHKEILLSSANVNKLYQAQGNMIQAKRSGGFIDVYYAKTNGSLFIAERIGRLANFDARTREWYQLALNNTGVSLSEPYVGEENGLTMVTLSTPIVINGEIVAVMGADISLESLQHTINRYQVGKNAYAMMFNANDLILSHPDANQLMSSFNRLFPSLSPTEVQSSIKEEGIQIVENGETESLAYFKTVPNTNWIFAVIMDRKTEEGHHQELLQQLITMSVILTIVFIVIISGFITYLMRDFYRVSKALEDIAQGDGDLTRTIESASRDEIGRLATNFNTFVRNMHTMIGNIHSLAENLNQQADITAQQAQERSVRIQSQQNEINMVAAAVTEMSTATQEIASNAENTAQEGDITVSISEKGCQEVQRSQQSILKLANDIQNSTEVIKQLELHTQDISSILSSIQGIAEQTNLLALNAAIEAARAGEQGRGFAVVADEVRILSQRTHDSTNEIQQTIETLQSTTKTAVESMDSSQVGAENSVTDANTASESLDSIIQSVNRINDMATHIATAAEEQSLVTEEITRNTQAVNDVSFELATEAQEASKQAALLSDYSQQLHNEVSQFKL